MQAFSTPSPFLEQLTSTPILTELLDNVLSEERYVRHTLVFLTGSLGACARACVWESNKGDVSVS